METLKAFKDFVEEITSSNSKLFKQEVLNKYKDSEVIKEYLYFLYNPFIVTGISDKKLGKIKEYRETNIIIKTVKDLLKFIATNNTGSDVVLQTIFNFKNKDSQKPLDYLDYILFMGLSEPISYTAGKSRATVELETLLDKLITKNLQLGIDAKSINKVFPKLIPTFNVQLANKYFDNPKIVEGKEFTLTTKIDGGRIIAIHDEAGVSFYTRAGQKYEGLVDLEREMQLFTNSGTVFDGEITLLDKGNLTSKEQYKQTMMITRKDGEKHGVKMLVFDCMTLSEFINQECNKTYSERRKNLGWIFNPPQGSPQYEPKYFEVLPRLYTGTDTSEITKWLNYNIAHGEEGVMININDAKYCFGRTNDLLKVKKFNSCDLQIIGFEEGDNRHMGRLGAVLVEYKGNVVKVGSGFSDELRTSIWEHKDEWLGRTIVVQYFEETTNQNGGISLRFPVYLDYRTDK